MAKVSIVIPVAKINDYVRESLAHIAVLEHTDYEVLVCPDSSDGERSIDAKIIPTGKVSPAEKRDIAVGFASGDVIAFLDDDAYPRPDWLTNALPHFRDPEVAAVGGPAVTAPADNVLQKASGYVFSSFMGGGGLAYRYKPGAPREVDDFPSVNLLVKKDAFLRAGGFDTRYWPGEDTKLCLDITRKLHMKIVYEPTALVWHHRRTLFLPHLKQVYNYAIHRGFFVKRFPETSLRPQYFVPSVLVLALSMGSLSFLFSRPAGAFYLLAMAAYIVAVVASSMAEGGIKVTPLVSAGVVSTHLAYGLGFMRGLVAGKLRR